MYRLLLALVCAAVGLAQMPVPVPDPIITSLFPPALTAYFTLTSAQVDSIDKANQDYARYQAGKQARMAQVQLEIAQETAKDVVDPMALGVRYAELEGIRRELSAQLNQTRKTVAAVLTDAQKVKLQALDAAAKLQPLISQAQCENLLAPVAAQVTGGLSSISSILLGVTDAVFTGTACGAVILNGDFSPTPIPAPVQP